MCIYIGVDVYMYIDYRCVYICVYIYTYTRRYQHPAVSCCCSILVNRHKRQYVPSVDLKP